MKRIVAVVLVLFSAAVVCQAQIPDLQVLCGQFAAFCVSSCKTYEQQCSSLLNTAGNNGLPIPTYPVVGGGGSDQSSEQISQPDEGSKVHGCKRQGGTCTSNRDCCREFYCKHLKHSSNGYPAKIGTCQLPNYLDKITPRKDPV